MDARGCEPAAAAWWWRPRPQQVPGARTRGSRTGSTVPHRRPHETSNPTAEVQCRVLQVPAELATLSQPVALTSQNRAVKTRPTNPFSTLKHKVYWRRRKRHEGDLNATTHNISKNEFCLRSPSLEAFKRSLKTIRIPRAFIDIVFTRPTF